MLSLFAWTILASLSLAGGLALLGTQLAARDRGMQTLCMGQGAMLGVLVGLGLVGVYFEEGEHFGLSVPLLVGILGAAGTFLLSERLVAQRLASSNTYFCSLFSLLMAGGYLMSAFFPALENHMTQKYFGDLATMGSIESYLAIGVGLLLTLVLALGSRHFTRQSFDLAISGQNKGFWGLPLSVFDLITLVALCFCIQTVGYLFTIACLFLPTAAASRSLRPGLRPHLGYCFLLASSSAVIGFLLSLQYSRLPTVPSIIACMVLISTTIHFLLKIFHRLMRSHA